MSTNLEEPNDQIEDPPSRPWLTTFVSLVACGLYIFAQTVAFGVLFFVQARNSGNWDANTWVEQASRSGFVLGISCLSATAVVVLFILVVSRFLTSGSPNEFLGLRLPEAKQATAWIFATLAFICAADSLTWLLGREIVPEFMRNAFLAEGSLPLFVLALLVAAPVGEELIFRGLMYRGLMATRLKLVGTSVVTSLAWASMHWQYDLYNITVIFVAGILFTFARHSGQSTITCIGMHSTMNLVATIETAWEVSGT